MSENKLPVLVSLPRNDLSLAEAALRGGADGVKVHLNAFHRASGTKFGSFREEETFLRELAKLPGRRAIMIGQEDLPSREEMAALEEMGFEGYNLYLRFVKPYLLESKMRPILALEKGFTDSDIDAIKAVRGSWIEASTVDPEKYGQPLEASDLADYRRIVERFQGSVIVPSQKKIAPSDLPALKKTGVAGILIGVIVAGSTPQSIESAAREFKTGS